jgi:hypothetical protein
MATPPREFTARYYLLTTHNSQAKQQARPPLMQAQLRPSDHEQRKHSSYVYAYNHFFDSPGRPGRRPHDGGRFVFGGLPPGAHARVHACVARRPGEKS